MHAVVDYILDVKIGIQGLGPGCLGFNGITDIRLEMDWNSITCT